MQCWSIVKQNFFDNKMIFNEEKMIIFWHALNTIIFRLFVSNRILSEQNGVSELRFERGRKNEV